MDEQIRTGELVERMELTKEIQADIKALKEHLKSNRSSPDINNDEYETYRICLMIVNEHLGKYMKDDLK